MNFHSTSLKAALLASSAMILTSTVMAQETEQPVDQQEVEEITVSASFIPDEKRSTSEVANILSADDFVRTGDADIAAALTRVPGLSVVGGRFVFVRGLGERYSSTTLDGSNFPGTDPLRRVVALDILPTALVDDVLVQKTHSPQYALEFGGGVVAIRTKGVPDDFVLEAGISANYNTVSTFEQGLSYDSPDIEITTFGGSARNIPTELAALEFGGTAPANVALSLPNVYSADFEENLPNANLNFTIGDAWDVGESRLGVLASVNWTALTQNRNGIRQDFTILGDGVTLVPNNQFSADGCASVTPNPAVNLDECGFRSTQAVYNLSALLTVGFELDASNSFKFVSTSLRQGLKETIITQGVSNVDRESLINRTRLDWIETSAWFNQLSGDHEWSLFGNSDTFLDTLVKWRFAYTRTDRDAPLRRQTEYLFEDNRSRFELRGNVQGNSTSFNALDDDQIEAGIDIVQPFEMGGISGDFKTGFTYFEKDRIGAARQFSFVGFTGQTFQLRSAVPEIIFSEAFVNDDNGLRLQDFSDESNTFRTGLQMYQAYTGLDVQLTEKIRVAAGLRFENSLQETLFLARTNLPLSRFVNLTDQTVGVDCPDPLPEGEACLVQQDSDFLLPSATLTYEFADNLQLRLGYSQTLSRPDLRETTPALFLDTERNRFIQGFPFLQITRINNYDARAEWYFGSGEQATVAVFYKEFNNPIERVFGILGSDTLFTSFRNQESAELYGIEAEIQKNLNYQDWFGWDWLGEREFFITANVSLIESEITIDANSDIPITNSVRRLQGQSDVLVNLIWGWEDYDTGESFALSYNYTGDRIFEVGINGAPDVIEEPPIFLDANFRYPIAEGIKLTLSVENILGDNFVLKQGDRIFERYDIGVTYGIGVGFEF